MGLNCCARYSKKGSRSILRARIYKLWPRLSRLLQVLHYSVLLCPIIAKNQSIKHSFYTGLVNGLIIRAQGVCFRRWPLHPQGSCVDTLTVRNHFPLPMNMALDLIIATSGALLWVVIASLLSGFLLGCV